MKELGRFGARFGSGELAFDRKNVLAKPGQQLAFTTRDGGILRQMRVTIDQPRENGHCSVVDPSDRLRPLHAPKIVILAHFRDPPIFDDQCAAQPTPQGAKLRRIDEKTPDAEQLTVLGHTRCL